ncbi:GrpB family protein [Streptomyces sp. NPDC059897]|uniref:GrpB family protein n=1 Tax=Streptomyces sp. NPDC059897 TaxID=3346994 RepID=UPI0036525546
MAAVSESGGIYVVEYDPCWPQQAATAIDALRAAVPGLFVEIEHIGSTAVPGLAAKPVIDLMAAVHDLPYAALHHAALAGLGFHPHDNGMTDRLLYVRADDADNADSAGNRVRSHILHVVTLESWPTRNQRILRDHMRTHPEDAARYARLKRAIVAAGTGAGAYSRAKTTLVQELTDRARAQRGLPSVPVWEKR